MILGLILALASAVATNLAFLLKHRGAVLAPPIEVAVRCAAPPVCLLEWFAVGWIVAIVAWGLHVGALSLAALSIVQAVLSGGLVFLAVLAERFFGFHSGDGNGSASRSPRLGCSSSDSRAAAPRTCSAPRWRH